MDAAAERSEGKSVWDVLIGLQLGVMGGILMLVWFAVISPVLGYPWWLIANLFASHFYDSRDVYLGAGIVTVVGAALQIATSGVAGCLSGVLTPAGRLSGLAAAFAWYLFCTFFLWKRIAPLVLIEMVQPILWTGYFLFGSVLGWHRQMVTSQILKAQRANLGG